MQSPTIVVALIDITHNTENTMGDDFRNGSQVYSYTFKSKAHPRRSTRAQMSALRMRGSVPLIDGLGYVTRVVVSS